MNLMDAVERVEALTQQASVQEVFDLGAMDAFSDFWANNWEEIEAAYGHPDQIRALEQQGAMPKYDGSIPEDLANDHLDRQTWRCLQLARTAASASGGQGADPDEAFHDALAINLFAAFWSARGPAICAELSTYDIGGVFSAMEM